MKKNRLDTNPNRISEIKKIIWRIIEKIKNEIEIKNLYFLTFAFLVTLSLP